MRFQSLSPKNISLVESSILPLFLGSCTAFSPTKSINHKHPYQIYKKKNLYHYTLSYTYYLPIFIIIYFFYVSNILSVFTTIKTLSLVFTRYIVSQKCLLQLKFNVVIFFGLFRYMSLQLLSWRTAIAIREIGNQPLQLLVSAPVAA